MNRYPVWKYAIILIVLLVSVLFTLPNFFGEAPSVQVSSAKSSIKVDSTTQLKIEEALKTAGLTPDGVTFDGKSIKALFKDTDTQLKAKDAIQKSLVPDATAPNYVVALNLVRRSPAQCFGRSAYVPGFGFAWRRTFHASGGHGSRTD
jgi:preprotein translocase subunit SecD